MILQLAGSQQPDICIAAQGCMVPGVKIYGSFLVITEYIKPMT